MGIARNVNQRSDSTIEQQYFNSLLHAARVALPLGGAFAVLAGPVYWMAGAGGLIAAGVAAVACALSSVGAAAAALPLAGNPFAATVLTMMLRMALPLVFLVVVVASQPSPLLDAGLAFYLIGFYLVALAADTHYAVGRIQLGATASKGM